MNKLIKIIKQGTFFQILKSKLRIVIRIKNKNVYAAYWKQKEYNKLEKKYRDIIKEGVDSNLPKVRSNTIWVCWLQGIENAPDLVRACVNSIERGMKNSKLIILTETNISNYIEFPDYIERKKKLGIIPNAQYTDILRTAVLCKYGGIWMDATVLCTAKSEPDYLYESDIFVFKQLDLERKDTVPIELSNWFISAKSNNEILLLTLKLLYAYWKDYNHLSHYFIYHLFFTMAARRYPELWDSVPVFNNHSPHTLQFELDKPYSPKRWNQLEKISDFHKLNRRLDFSSDPLSMYSFIINQYGDGNE